MSTSLPFTFMILIPLPAPRLHSGDDLASALCLHEKMQSGDILVISSKAIATVEGTQIDLSTMNVSAEAVALSKKTKRSPEFCQAVLEECDRLHGSIIRAVPGALLTEVQPDGMKHGTILVANAGLDESNTHKGSVIGWPMDPVGTVERLSDVINKSPFAIILSDSVCTPRRQGVTAIALATCGMDPFSNNIGTTDLFNRPLTITVEATADQLATAANALMGNAAQSIPAVIIRDHNLPFSNFCGWVPGIKPEEDLFGKIGVRC